MTPSAGSARVLLRVLAAAVVLLVFAGPVAANTPERGDFDARPLGDERVPAGRERARDALLERLGSLGLVSEEQRTGTPRAVAKLDGFLTGESRRDATSIALDYVRDRPGVFGLDSDDLDGLELTRRSASGGVEHLTWEQRYRGIPSADTQLQAAVTASGRLLSVSGAPAPDLAVPTIEPLVSAERAYATARRTGRAGSPTRVDEREAGPQEHTKFADGGSASLVLFQDGHGARLAWRVLAPVSSTEFYDTLVDARSGAVVRRINRVDFAAAARAFPINPEQTTQQPVTFPDNWLPTGSTTLHGPYVHAFIDPSDHVDVGSWAPRPEDEVRSLSQDGTWNYALSTFSPLTSDGCTPAAPCTWSRRSANSWQANANQSATQLFYLVNTFREHLAGSPISFGGLGFAGDDPILAQAMDGAAGANGRPDDAHVNNTSFLTLPDGTPGLLQAHLFSRESGGHLTPYGDYDSANEASLIFHEYAHGLSSRLVTDAQGYGALETAQAGAIGEGTSDFFALDYLVGRSADEFPLADDSARADVRLGSGYLDRGDKNGLRYQPIDCDPSSPLAQCPTTPGTDGGGFTYADFGKVFGGPEVHSDGEIWAQTLWDLRQRMIADHGAGGIDRTRELVTEAMRLSPPEPSFLDMRNAILAASTSDDAAIWGVFSNRGMGYFASTASSDDIAPIADTHLPPAPASEGTLRGTVSDDEGRRLAGAHVGIAGHDTQGRGAALGPELADDTDAMGGYVISAPVGEYPSVTARRSGLRDEARPASVSEGSPTTLNFTLTRDWSSTANGASVERFTGPNNTASGCGPAGLIDDQSRSVWGSNTAPGGQTIVIDLGATIDVAGVAIDPSAGCGDDPTAGLKDYEVRGSTAPDGESRPLGPAGAFAGGPVGLLRDVPGSVASGVRYVQLQAKSPQSTTAGGSGADYVDVAELHVAKVPGSPVGAAADTGSAQSVGYAAATLTGSVVPHGGSAQVIFEYGTSTAYGSAVAAGSTPAGESATSVAAVVTGLQASTTYHFRVVALRDGRRYEGGDSAFTTGAAPTSAPPSSLAEGTAKPTSLLGTRLKADRKGFFKVRVSFGDRAPLGSARLTVSRKRKRLARATTPVRPSRTVTKTLRLTKKGRRAIKAGRTWKVTLELRLPGGQKVRKGMKLTRAKR